MMLAKHTLRTARGGGTFQGSCSLAFHSRAEHSDWIRRVVHSRIVPPAAMALVPDGERAAPLLWSVNPFASQLEVRGVPGGLAPAGSCSASMLEATWQLGRNSKLQRAVAEMHGSAHSYSAMKLGKFYEALDALTADVAHKHLGAGNEFALVTGGHYNSVKLSRATPGVDLTIRCYVTSVGSSSLEARTALNTHRWRTRPLPIAVFKLPRLPSPRPGTDRQVAAVRAARRQPEGEAHQRLPHGDGGD